MKPLKIGAIIGDEADLDPADRKLLGRIIGDDALEIAALLISAPGDDRSGRVFRGWMSLEARVFPKAQTGPHDDEDLSAIPYIRLAQASAADLQAFDFDVVLKLTPGDLNDREKEVIAGAARFGLWAMDFNAGARTARDMLGFREVVEKKATSNVALLCLPVTGKPQIVAEAAFNTKMSASFNAAFILDKSVTLVVRELRRLALTGALEPGTVYEKSEVALPSIATWAGYILNLVAGLTSRIIARFQEAAGFRPGMWQLRSGRATFDTLDELHRFDPTTGVDIFPEGGRYWADPFLIREAGEDYVFFEDYAYASQKGAISVGKFEGEKFRLIGVALSADYHLSYPYLFRHGGELFMLPETNQSRRVEIWRCRRFPDDWVLHSTALEGQAAADSILTEWNGAWWLFTNLSTDGFGDHCSDLHIFKVDGPDLQRLEPNAHNPVIIDSTTGRNGGRIFPCGGRLIRPAQNNSFGDYGYGLNFMEVTALSLRDYQEKMVKSITSDFAKGAIGCHHFDHGSGRWVIDIRRKIGGRPKKQVRRFTRRS